MLKTISKHTADQQGACPKTTITLKNTFRSRFSDYTQDQTFVYFTHTVFPMHLHIILFEPMFLFLLKASPVLCCSRPEASVAMKCQKILQKVRAESSG